MYPVATRRAATTSRVFVARRTSRIRDKAAPIAAARRCSIIISPVFASLEGAKPAARGERHGKAGTHSDKKRKLGAARAAPQGRSACALSGRAPSRHALVREV